ncbi:hypothetical protein BDR06DRAFT_1009162 [Suillus hirtellus]|nr:hypothetical protein BDR06DRAFT_1009162 [Suillus hirtellus]
MDVFLAGSCENTFKCPNPTGGQGPDSAYKIRMEARTRQERTCPQIFFGIYNAERLPVISEILKIPTLILNIIPFMFDINCRFSNIVLDEFRGITQCLYFHPVR